MGLKFENLRVWQMALNLSGEIDELSFTFPKREEYVLSPQIRRAAESFVQENELQLLDYLRATDKEIGLLFNFGKKPEFRRKIFTNDKKKITIENP